MSKFNTKKESARIENYMGAPAFSQSAKEELAFSVLSSFIEKSYYESTDDRIKRIKGLIETIVKKDPLFIAKLAVYVRKEAHMRSSFHILIAELARAHRGDDLVQRALVAGTERPDDLIEIAAYLGKPIPNQIKKGIAKVLARFDAYHLTKYQGTNKKFNLIDLFNLTKPKPDEKKAALWKEFMTGKLPPANTWETRLSSGEDRTKVWGEMVANNEMGYMALLRNLRNILKDADAPTVKEAAKRIADKEAVEKSKQLPFRFLSAYSAVNEFKSEGLVFEKDVDRIDVVKKALNKAVGYSVKNIPLLKGRTVILSDNSGSMTGDGGSSSTVSAYSNRTTADIANLFAVLYWTRADNTLIGLFGDTLVTPRLDREASVFDNFSTLKKSVANIGGGTETGIFKMFNQLIKDKTIVDRIVIFSDCQIGTGCNWYDDKGHREDDFHKLFNAYKKINPSVLVYSVDLKGYGSTVFSDGVMQLAGWSDKIFDTMRLFETDKKALLHEIESMQL